MARPVQRKTSPLTLHSQEHEMKRNARTTYLNTIQNRDSYPTHVVVSAIQGLYHVSEFKDEKYLFPLLECDNESIVSEALIALYANFHVKDCIIDKIIQLASTYVDNERGSSLQQTAINILEELSLNDKALHDKLISIAENYKNIKPESDSAFVNAKIWQFLAKNAEKKLNSDDQNELIWNIHSERSDRIRNEIRKALVAKT